jgi:dimethylglycine dehydrogenase
MLRVRAGIIDISHFVKYVVQAMEAQSLLDAISTNKLPSKIGASCMTPLISKRGGVVGDFTVTRVKYTLCWIICSDVAERYHQPYFQQVPLPEGATFKSKTDSMCGFNVASPKAWILL